MVEELNEGKAAASGFTWWAFKNIILSGILFVLFIEKIFFITIAYSDRFITRCKKYFKERRIEKSAEKELANYNDDYGDGGRH